jgi:hypothetical protein
VWEATFVAPEEDYRCPLALCSHLVCSAGF